MVIDDERNDRPRSDMLQSWEVDGVRVVISNRGSASPDARGEEAVKDT